MDPERLLADGPANYWSGEKEPTPAQLRALAASACRVLGIPEPTTRLQATTTIARLRIAETEIDPEDLPEIPEPW